MEKLVLQDSDYKIKKAKILSARQMTDFEKFFEITLENGDNLGHEPGQFVNVSIFGIGEAPISISSSPTKRGSFELCVRAVGKFTCALHRLGKDDKLGIRGPFGKGFPVKRLEGCDLLFIAGGIGLVPLRSLINFAIDKRNNFGNINILLGVRTPKDILFTEEIGEWNKRSDINFKCTVDRGDTSWSGNVGLITSLIPDINIDPEKTFAIVVGPPIMYKFVLLKLLEKNIPEDQIFLSLERHMKCGLGKCGHCQIQNIYCCQDGPVFSYDKIKHLKEAL